MKKLVRNLIGRPALPGDCFFAKLVPNSPGVNRFSTPDLTDSTSSGRGDRPGDDAADPPDGGTGDSNAGDEVILPDVPDPESLAAAARCCLISFRFFPIFLDQR